MNSNRGCRPFGATIVHVEARCVINFHGIIVTFLVWGNTLESDRPILGPTHDIEPWHRDLLDLRHRTANEWDAEKGEEEFTSLHRHPCLRYHVSSPVTLFHNRGSNEALTMSSMNRSAFSRSSDI
ncbi:MAG: hypothetical protein IH951_11770 [Bacteroidetes bacterium]|nr:hypothetical protein [Bacteroidota bacterium]